MVSAPTRTGDSLALTNLAARPSRPRPPRREPPDRPTWRSARQQPTSRSTPWRWRSGAAATIFKASSTTPIAAAQYLSIRYTERLVEAGVELSVGARGDAHDALAETIIGLHKTELIRRRDPWKGSDDVECATLQRLDWLNHRRLLGREGLGRDQETQATEPPVDPGQFNV